MSAVRVLVLLALVAPASLASAATQCGGDVKLTGDARGCVAVSGLGTAEGRVAVVGAGEASGRDSVVIAGRATGDAYAAAVYGCAEGDGIAVTVAPDGCDEVIHLA